MRSVSRSTFLKSAGVAAGAAAISISPAAAASGVPGPVEVTPSLPLPADPVVAIVRNVALGEVTVLVGTTEKTYKDRELTRLLEQAARRNSPATGEGAA